MTKFIKSTTEPTVEELARAVYEEVKPSRTWLNELRVQNFMDGLAPKSTEVRIIPAETFFGAFDAFVVHHSYKLEFRENRILRGQIEVVIGVHFDLHNVQLENLDYVTSETTATQEFLKVFPRSSTYRYSWSSLSEIVPPLLEKMEWPQIVFPVELNEDIDLYTTWLYDSDLDEIGGTW